MIDNKASYEDNKKSYEDDLFSDLTNVGKFLPSADTF